jgi:hypothetical protein
MNDPTILLGVGRTYQSLPRKEEESPVARMAYSVKSLLKGGLEDISTASKQDLTELRRVVNALSVDLVKLNQQFDTISP